MGNITGNKENINNTIRIGIIVEMMRIDISCNRRLNIQSSLQLIII